MASIAQIKNLRKCKNKYRHRWIDEGLRDSGFASYSYICKYCAQRKIKASAYAASYYDRSGKLIGNIAPECVERHPKSTDGS